MAGHDKVAVVTGAGTGIGKAVTLAFLKDGYRVVLAGRRREPLEQTVAEAGSQAIERTWALLAPYLGGTNGSAAGS